MQIAAAWDAEVSFTGRVQRSAGLLWGVVMTVKLRVLYLFNLGWALACACAAAGRQAGLGYVVALETPRTKIVGTLVFAEAKYLWLSVLTVLPINAQLLPSNHCRYSL